MSNPGRNSGVVSRQRGITLVETMISATLGVLLLVTLMAVFVAGNRNYRQDFLQSRLQESARFALNTLAEDLSMLNFYGNYVAPSGGGAIPVSDCGSGTTSWAMNHTTPVLVLGQATADSAASGFTCIDADVFHAGTDVLALKRAEGRPIGLATLLNGNANDPFEGQILMYNSPSDGGGMVVMPADPGGEEDLTESPGDGTDGEETPEEDPLQPNTNYWRYMAHIYYIRNESLMGSGDGIPTLYRKNLVGTSITESDGGIARGIEMFHVEFGIDTEALDGSADTVPDGVPNLYVNNPTDVQRQAMVTAKIYVLARSEEQVAEYKNTKTYRLGSVSRTVDDGFYRRVFSTTVRLRNAVAQTYARSILPG
jgi:type IV pilus assembly protein PilW